MRKTILTALVICGLTVSVKAQDFSYAMTDGKINGHGWIEYMDSLSRTYYVQGYIDGSNAGTSEALIYMCKQTVGSDEFKSLYPKVLFQATRPKEVATEITRLYANPINLPIPAMYIVKVAIHAFAGTPEADLEKELVDLRQQAAIARNKQP